MKIQKRSIWFPGENNLNINRVHLSCQWHIIEQNNIGL